MPRSRKAMSTATKIPQKTKVDFSVQRMRRNVKMNQPCCMLDKRSKAPGEGRREIPLGINQESHRT